MRMDDAVQIVVPEEDKLANCPVCKSDNVAYVQKIGIDMDVLWHGMCFNCEHIGPGAAAWQVAGKMWNGENNHEETNQSV